MNLHVFNDSHGYNLNLVIGHCQSAGAFKKNIFINLNKKTIYKNDKAEYLNNNILSFKKRIKSLAKIESVSFCPLDYSAAYFLKELKKQQPLVKVNWIFWSYEFYHQYNKYENSLTGFSLKYYKKNHPGIKSVLAKLKLFVKQILFIPVSDRKLLKAGYKLVNNFYSFLPQDYKNVSTQVNNFNCQYQPISFLSIEQITQNIKGDTHYTDEIVIGHAGRLTANHYEIIKKLSELSISNKILMPMEYGDAGYKAEIKKLALAYFDKQINFLENRLDMQSYFKRLSCVRFGIFNFTNQEGLGNIIFLIWNGAKVFLQKESSVYKQFTIWKLKIFSVEEELTKQQLQEPLEAKYINENKLILEDMFCDKKVKEYWKPLFQ